jgi:hypothetical protein
MPFDELFRVVITIIAPLAASVTGYYFKTKRDDALLKESGKKIAQAESRVEAEPARAKPAWDLARVTLEAYFNRNLSQVASIFWLSAIVMAVGFGVIVWGVFQSYQSPNTVGTAAIASISGILTEFIGATFLFIYRSTVRQAIDYSKTLERINSVGMAMQILDTMPDETKPDDLKNRTKANLVELLVRQSYEVQSLPPHSISNEQPKLPVKANNKSLRKATTSP